MPTDSDVLDKLAAELQLNHPKTFSLATTGGRIVGEECGGCGAPVVDEHYDAQGSTVRSFACGHRYVIGRRSLTIERL